MLFHSSGDKIVRFVSIPPPGLIVLCAGSGPGLCTDGDQMLGWRAERHGAAFGLVILRNASDEESFSREGFRFFAYAQNDMTGIRFFAGAQNDMEEGSVDGMLCRAIRESPLRGGAVRLGSGTPQRLAGAGGGNGLLSVRVISLGQHRAIPAYRLRRRNDCALLPQMLCQMALSATRCRWA